MWRLMMWRLITHTTTPGEARGLLTAWLLWERITHYLWPSDAIPGAPHGILRFRRARYHGAPFALPDGTEIDGNTIVGELHCDNFAILRLVQRRCNPFASCREDLRSLAEWMKHDDRARQIEAFYGITMLSKGAARLGMTVRIMPPSLGRRFQWIFFIGMLLLYTEDGVKRLDRGSTPRSLPQEVWISRRALIGRYGDASYQP